MGSGRLRRDVNEEVREDFSQSILMPMSWECCSVPQFPHLYVDLFIYYLFIHVYMSVHCPYAHEGQT